MTGNANDNKRPTRLTELIAVTIEDFLIRAEKDVEEGEEPIAPVPALVELAASALCQAILEDEGSHDLGQTFDLHQGRTLAMLLEEVERFEAQHKPKISLVTSNPAT
jgi:hypothetical protein